MTAVQWLYEKIKSNIDAEDGSMNMNWLYDDTFQQAKEMEKKKLIEMHNKGFDSVKQLNDDYAIEFAAYLDGYLQSTLTRTKTIRELLEIFKKEKGL
jgi:hypothetical protein